MSTGYRERLTPLEWEIESARVHLAVKHNLPYLPLKFLHLSELLLLRNPQVSHEPYPAQRRAHRRHAQFVIISIFILVILPAVRDLLSLHNRLVIFIHNCRLFLFLVTNSFNTRRCAVRSPIPLEPASWRGDVVWCAPCARGRVRVPHIPYRALREHPVRVTDRSFSPACPGSATCCTARNRAATSTCVCGVNATGLDVVVESFDDVSCRGGFF
jgi:hypothetical protein